MDRPAPTVAIVGAGASGTLLAAQLLRRHHPHGVRVVLIERRPEPGRGVAYSTPHDYHRLNVPAEQMGALPRDPRHFMRWASRNGHGIVVGDFAPRGLFGAYLGSLLAEAERAAGTGSAVERLSGDVVAGGVDELRRRAWLELASGVVIEADRVVLALGNLAPADPPGADAELLASGRYEADPWATGLGGRAAADDLVLLLGTGLTMVDVALTLGKETFAPKLLAVSRNGLVPQPHRRGGLPPRRFQLQQERVRLDELVDEVAQQIYAAELQGGDWRQVIDSMRPVTNQIWHRFSDADRRRFVDRLSRRWDVHRHRMAPEVAAMLAHLRRTNRLELGAASVQGMRLDGHRVIVTLDRAERGVEELPVSRVINCTGPALDLRAAREPLLESLFASGAIRTGPLRLGLDHDPRAALLDASGAASRVLFGIGPMRKGRLWETTAIPEIRTQAFDLADQITSDLAREAGRPQLALAG
jgi:uncharacterized NAD(P)/FAD-binding protein YdhS